MLWLPDLCGAGDGVSFVELAIDFLLRTSSQLPQWTSRDGWLLPPIDEVCTVNLSGASRTMAAIFKWLISVKCLPVQVRSMRVETLGRLGHKGHAVAGLAVRPLLDLRVNQLLRSTFHRERGARSLRLPFTVLVGETALPLALL